MVVYNAFRSISCAGFERGLAEVDISGPSLRFLMDREICGCCRSGTATEKPLLAHVI